MVIVREDCRVVMLPSAYCVARLFGMTVDGVIKSAAVQTSDFLSPGAKNLLAPVNFRRCPKMYAASNKSVVDIEKSDGKCLNVIEHLLGKTAGFTHRTAYPLA